MADIVSPSVRSRMMSGIKGKNTKPELFIRKGLFARGFRYILHDRRLPGTPDLVFPRHHAVVIINGCFWHGHGCHLFKWPKSNTAFWRTKIEGNKRNDKKHRTLLKTAGWNTLVVWECAVKGSSKWPAEGLFEKISNWIVSSEKNEEIAGTRRRASGAK